MVFQHDAQLTFNIHCSCGQNCCFSKRRAGPAVDEVELPKKPNIICWHEVLLVFFYFFLHKTIQMEDDIL